jgi:hypothetical protein
MPEAPGPTGVSARLARRAVNSLRNLASTGHACYMVGDGKRRVALPAGPRETLQMSAFVYKRRSPLGIPLRLLDYAITADSYESVLSAVASGIRAAEKRINSGGEEVAEYEVEIIENLLGVAYVTCQPQITAIVQAVLRSPGHGLNARALRDRGPRFDGSYSRVEVLWGLANYFKHRDEWSRDTWTNPPNKMTEHTVKVITAAGLECSNLRTGAEALGNTAYSDVGVFQEIIRAWSADVREHIRSKFGH